MESAGSESVIMAKTQTNVSGRSLSVQDRSERQP
jgi:hypothetical protein